MEITDNMIIKQQMDRFKIDKLNAVSYTELILNKGFSIGIDQDISQIYKRKKLSDIVLDVLGDLFDIHYSHYTNVPYENNEQGIRKALEDFLIIFNITLVDYIDSLYNYLVNNTENDILQKDDIVYEFNSVRDLVGSNNEYISHEVYSYLVGTIINNINVYPNSRVRLLKMLKRLDVSEYIVVSNFRENIPLNMIEDIYTLYNDTGISHYYYIDEQDLQTCIYSRAILLDKLQGMFLLEDKLESRYYLLDTVIDLYIKLSELNTVLPEINKMILIEQANGEIFNPYMKTINLNETSARQLTSEIEIPKLLEGFIDKKLENIPEGDNFMFDYCRYRYNIFRGKPITLTDILIKYELL